jgi:plasmid maintenance system antidote protein VapI
MTFLDRVDMLLARRGLNKNQLAALTGIPVSTVYGWYKKGYGSITLPTMLKLSEFFGCSMEYLVNGATAVEKTPSPAAMDVARHYDSLPEHTQKLISALVLFESADLDVKNNIIAHLVDHANDKLAKESAFNAASDQIMEALMSGPSEED